MPMKVTVDVRALTVTETVHGLQDSSSTGGLVGGGDILVFSIIQEPVTITPLKGPNTGKKRSATRLL